jgi:anti-sigma regulatory factor (Ser/Thr protein kinase)
VGPVIPPRVVEDVGWYCVNDVSAVGTVRRAAMRLAGVMGYDEQRIGQVGIVATEIATNVVVHAGEGDVVLRVVRAAGLGAVEVVAYDRGPGIADMANVVRDGESSAGTLGVGLGAIARLATHWDIHSIVGRGTVLAATLWPAGTTSSGDGTTSGVTRPIPGEEQCGDGWAVRTDDGSLQVMLSDGLGHGPLAALATAKAVAAFLDGPRDRPAGVLRRIHGVMGHTRGAAIAVAEFDVGARCLVYAGIGNVAGSIVEPGKRRGLVSYPGIVGHQIRAVRESTHDLALGAVLVLHSDGVRERWDAAHYPGLFDRDPVVIAATLLRDEGGRRDDASVLVARVA